MSGKSQGILRWMISGNPEFSAYLFSHSVIPDRKINVSEFENEIVLS